MSITHQTWEAGPALVYCLASVVDGGPTVNQRWANVTCLLGINLNNSRAHRRDNQKECPAA